MFDIASSAMTSSFVSSLSTRPVVSVVVVSLHEYVRVILYPPLSYLGVHENLTVASPLAFISCITALTNWSIVAIY